ncbi:hypothetical protein B0T22DRAFT_489286 [Podospora appendiculata]|uniref:Heterokaryon incompatibility domain-containing protein n=1 Tax=Podospora appendiculata TaxID=314037 RepID=A0AAE0X7E2_9PEZI|nr:hypothetical protein B0T22DRAFT_489286 [Podospora appendiculata]
MANIMGGHHGDRAAAAPAVEEADIQAVLQELIRDHMDEYGGEQQQQPLLPTPTPVTHTTWTNDHHDDGSTTSTTSADEPCLTFHVRDKQVPVAFRDVLSTFWDSDPRLDTECHTCEQPIVDEPPIQTISLPVVGPASEVLVANTTPRLHVRVTNRHYSCLKAANIPWVPVSHVWEDSIRTANQSKPETYHNHEEAAATLLRTLEALLDAAVDTYEPSTEFWHDYFSVPQWDRHAQQALLLRIPSIYYDAQEILIHMSDLLGGYIMTLMPDGPSEFSAAAALRFMPALQALCSSQWMERMWVLLEYSLCRRACVMDRSDYVWRRAPDRGGSGGGGAMMPDTFTSLVRNRHSILIGLFRHAKTFARRLKDGFLAGLTDKQQEPRNLCLGEALELVARTKCQLFRDKFLAINMLLHRTAPPAGSESAAIVPESATEACAWVWKTALTRRDFSLLLLQPREPQRGSDPPIRIPSWLIGHGDLAAAEWDLGSQRAPPQYPVRFTDSSTIETELDFMGTIEEIHYLDPEDLGEAAGVEAAIGILCSLDSDWDSGTRGLSAAELVDGLNRIFPLDAIHTAMAQMIGGLTYTLVARQNQDRRFTLKVDRCVAEYLAAPSRSVQRQYVAQRVTQLLKYDTHFAGGISAEITRLTTSRHIARSRNKRGAANGEPICAARCAEPACRALTVFRLDLRESAKVGDRLYRFPGLSYAGTVENGVGLVLDHAGRITGRMRFGPPRCGCQTRQTVQIR